MSQTNAVHAHPNNNLKIHFIFTLPTTSTSSPWSVTAGLHNSYWYGLSPIPHTSHALPLIPFDLISRINFRDQFRSWNFSLWKPTSHPLHRNTYTNFLNTLFRRTSLCILLCKREIRIYIHVQSNGQNYFSLYLNLYVSE